MQSSFQAPFTLTQTAREDRSRLLRISSKISVGTLESKVERRVVVSILTDRREIVLVALVMRTVHRTREMK